MPRVKMHYTGAALLCACAILTTGCGDLLSLHPIYTKNDKVLDPALEGRWEDDDDLLVVQRDGDLYKVTLQSKKIAAESHKYEVHLVDIDGIRFADLLVEDLLGHMFIRTSITATELRLKFLDSEWLRQHVAHEDSEVDGNRTQAVLTARTPQLRSMVAKFAREPKAYDEHEVVYHRIK